LRRHAAVERGGRRTVGRNVNVDAADPGAPLHRIDPAVEAAQVRRVQALRAARDDRAVREQLDSVRVAARGTENVLPPIREALRARATVGEVCGVLRREWGEYDR